MSDMLDRLYALILDRKAKLPAGSYTTTLFAKGEDEMVKKVGEEAIEVILAARGQGHERLVSESADLMYHLLVLLAAKDVSWSEVEAELEKRHKPH